MTELGAALGEVRAGIAGACRRAGRDPSEITLVAVSKTVPVEVVRAARDLGVADFGENRAGELAAKSGAVPATWHFIGTVQTGTARKVADHGNVIHSAVPGRALERIADRARRGGREIPCLLQVDFAGHRQGVAPEDAAGSIRAIAGLVGLRLVGLMTLPPWTGDPEGARPYFARLRAIRDGLAGARPELRELSMGMSDDYQVAIEEGATMVRVGTALFGDRPAVRAVR